VTLPKFNHIFVEVYTQNIYWIHCTPDQFRQRYKLEFGRECKEGLEGGRFFLENKNGYDIVVLWCNTAGSFDHMVHEIFHGVCWILKERHIHLDNSSCEEVYAYLIGSITKQILWKWNFKKGNKK
jgi:hypothetical protein